MKLGDTKKQWGALTKSWDQVGAPLRPNRDVIQNYEQALNNLIDEMGEDNSCMLMGVSPELVQLNWACSTQLIAVDHNQHVISNLWEPNPNIHSEVVCGCWSKLPFVDEFFAGIVGDGVVVFFQVPGRLKVIFEELNRVLLEGGKLIIRAFVQPPEIESLDQMLDDLEDHRIENFDVFKWRLAMALQACAGKGVRVNTIWETWRKCFHSVQAMAEKTGWPVESIETIHAYRGSDAVYHYPTLLELKEAFEENFELISLQTGSYPLAERCPLLTLGKRS